ncbi:uncharacterized protein LOC128259684 [Drosophila gunungcola]|uniref:Uncharacterized protein n=1 Tax=Drosophila gunungcola TaxID=103775 RepID=A0A9P9YJI7_9MUSC|nr:uncharacterized protein LOC128259684 [Drosophila gunungcola]KAI8037748.1 hypothetical protein M5D96_009248 [Drosophila gunungcola]
MWDYRQKIDFETSVKISPYCHAWQSVCWFMLKGLDLWKFLVSDRSPTYLVVLTIFLIGLSWMIFKKLRRRWKEVPMSEIQLLRDRVQFVSQDMVMLQDALNATLVSKPVASISNEVIDAFLERGTDEDEENPPPEPQESESATKNPDPEPQDNSLDENKALPVEKVPAKQAQSVNKPLVQPKPRRMLSQNPRDLNEYTDVEQRNVRRRQSIPGSTAERRM